MDDHVKTTVDLYDKTAEEYAKQAVINANLTQKEIEYFIKFLPSRGLILDAGCGSGRDSKYFLDHGMNVIGIDLSDKLLKIAQKYSPRGLFVKQDLRNIDFQVEYFDGIWACASLVHLKRDECEISLRKMWQILKPGGIIFVHQKAGKGETYKELPSMSGVKRFYNFYSKNQVREDVEQAGFQIDSIYAYNDRNRNNKKNSQWWISCFARKI